jgi:DNA-binding helix-hairpin-helix protein with protein kinase domain
LVAGAKRLRWPTLPIFAICHGHALEQKRAELYRHADEYRRLPALEASRLDDLERRKREIQLCKHLEGHLLARARILGIGDGRKATLASYGIENAWDVVDHKIRVVPGFGDELTQKLLDWKRSVENKFVFNPALGTDPAAIRQVKDEIARRRVVLEQALLRGPVDLQQIDAHAASARSRPPQRLTGAYLALKQTELDARCL